MSQAVQNKVYSLPLLPRLLVSLTFTSTSLLLSCLDPSPPHITLHLLPHCWTLEQRADDNRKKVAEKNKKVKVWVSLTLHNMMCTYLLCTLADLPFMLMDFQMMLGRNQLDTASTRNVSPLDESCSEVVLGNGFSSVHLPPSPPPPQAFPSILTAITSQSTQEDRVGTIKKTCVFVSVCVCLHWWDFFHCFILFDGDFFQTQTLFF